MRRLLTTFALLIPMLAVYPSTAEAVDVYCNSVANQSKTAISVPQPLTTATSFPEAVTLVTNCGEITIQLETKKAPFTATSLLTLMSASYYDGSLCHRITTSGLFVIQCGDPTSAGLNVPPGWKSYIDENLPVAKENNYPAGTVAMANSGPNSNGSQFFIVYKDTTLSPSYSIWGNVISGASILNFVSALGAQQGQIDGPLKQPLLIERVIPRDTQWMRAFNAGRAESIRDYEDKITKLAELPAENELLKAQVESYLKVSNNQLAQIEALGIQVKSLQVQLENLSLQLSKTTISCVKGKVTKKVTAVNPKCPSGYKVKK